MCGERAERNGKAAEQGGEESLMTEGHGIGYSRAGETPRAL